MEPEVRVFCFCGLTSSSVTVRVSVGVKILPSKFRKASAYVVVRGFSNEGLVTTTAVSATLLHAKVHICCLIEVFDW